MWTRSKYTNLIFILFEHYTEQNVMQNADYIFEFVKSFKIDGNYN